VLAQEVAPAADVKAADEPAQGDHGFWMGLTEEFRGRWAVRGTESAGLPSGESEDGEGSSGPADEQDLDLRLFGEGGLRDGSDRFAARFALAAWGDLDGTPEESFSALGSIHDAPRFDLDVYSLYADYTPGGSTGSGEFLKLARGGRQTASVGIPVTFDGIGVTVTPVRRTLDLFAFGGRTAHFFEAEAGLFEDWIGSAGFVLRPVPSVKLVGDYRFQKEDVDSPRTFGAGDEGEEEDEGEFGDVEFGRKSVTDHTYGLTAWYTPGEWLYLRAYGRGLDDQVSHAGGGAMAYWDAAGLGCEARADVQLATLKEVNESLNPYFAILGESLSNARFKVDLFKDLETGVGDFVFHAGYGGKKILDGEEKPFNREATRAYLLVAASDLFVSGPFVTLSGDAYLAGLSPDPAGEGFFTVGASLGFDGNTHRVEAGTYYQRFKYDYYRQVNEIYDVRTWFADVSMDILPWLEAEARYQWEQFDWDIHTFTLSLGQKY
jgi:hypothetical protein